MLLLVERLLGQLELGGVKSASDHRNYASVSANM